MATIKNPTTVIKSGGGSTEIVNGIIEQYKASTTTIDANTFVEFVNDYVRGTDTQLSTADYSYTDSKAVLVDTNKVFISYRNGNYLYGIVCTISGTTITVGTETQLSTGSTSYSYAAAAQVGTNKVFISHRNGAYLYGIVCTISGTTITVGTETQLFTNASAYTSYVMVRLDTNKVFAAYFSSTAYGVVCTISGTTITIGTVKSVKTPSNTPITSPAVLVDSNKVFIPISMYIDSVYYLYGVICTISGTTVNFGNFQQILSETRRSDYRVNSTLVDTNKVFTTYQDSLTLYLYGVIFTISGTSIIDHETTEISSRQSASAGNANRSMTLVDTNKVFVAYPGGNQLYGIVCTISGTAIKKGIETKLTTPAESYYYPSTVLLDSSTMFIAHGLNSKLSGFVFTSNFINNIKVSTDRVDGLTKTQCTTATAGDVWMLDN